MESSSYGTFSSSLKVSCLVEASTSWSCAFNNPWRNISLQISEVQRLYKYEACQVLLINFENFLFGYNTKCSFGIAEDKDELNIQV
jgi:hypothetical protein